MDSGLADYFGAFAVTGGLEEDALANGYDNAHDDYNKIMVKALSDRLAEAFAEYLHQQVRTKIWGYSPDEALSNDELIRENIKEHDLHRDIRLAQSTQKKQKFGNC